MGDEERIVFTDLEQPGLEIFTVDLSLLDCRVTLPLVKARARLETRLAQRELNRRLKLVAYCLLVCVGLTWLGSFMVSAMVRSVAARVPAKWDTEFGAVVIKQLGAKKIFLDDSNAVARLTALATPLLQVLPPSPNGYQFHIVEEEDPNAFALPGGHVVVNSGLLQMTERPEEVLAVIAHEVAHVTERHLYRKQISTAGPLMVCRIFLSGRVGALGALGGGTALVVGAGFSQEYETEADDIGWKYLVAANIDPRGMADTFRKMKAQPGAQPADFMPAAFSSHPALDKRIRRLEAKWVKLSRKEGFVVLDPAPILKP